MKLSRVGSGTVCTAAVPDKSLLKIVDCRALAPGALEAAVEQLRRAHPL
jgi:hypothetical protein